MPISTLNTEQDSGTGGALRVARTKRINLETYRTQAYKRITKAKDPFKGDPIGGSMQFQAVHQTDHNVAEFANLYGHVYGTQDSDKTKKGTVTCQRVAFQAVDEWIAEEFAKDDGTWDAKATRFKYKMDNAMAEAMTFFDRHLFSLKGSWDTIGSIPSTGVVAPTGNSGPQIWKNQRGRKFEVVANLITGTMVRRGVCRVKSFDDATGRPTFTTDLTTEDITSTSAGLPSGATAGDYLVPVGVLDASGNNLASPSLRDMCDSTNVASVHGLSSSTYEWWKPTAYGSAGNVTPAQMAALGERLQGVMPGVSKAQLFCHKAFGRYLDDWITTNTLHQFQPDGKRDFKPDGYKRFMLGQTLECEMVPTDFCGETVAYLTLVPPGAESGEKGRYTINSDVGNDEGPTALPLALISPRDSADLFQWQRGSHGSFVFENSNDDTRRAKGNAFLTMMTNNRAALALITGLTPKTAYGTWT